MSSTTDKTVEIRWHGRGGQGAKTACLLLAEAAFFSGKYVQGFPEYGPERMGAPITAYNRISDHELTVHSNIYTPDHVVVVDETLLHTVNVLLGLKEDGILISTHAIAMKGILEYLTPGSCGSYWSKYIGNCTVYAAELQDGAFTVPVELNLSR